MRTILRRFGLVLGAVLLVLTVMIVAAAIVLMKADWLSRFIR